MRHLLTPHEVFTAQYMEWEDIDNGDLLAVAVEHRFDVVVTTDKGFDYEQNLLVHDIALIMLRAKSNSMKSLAPLLPRLLAELNSPTKRRVTMIEAN
jgi:hypothetical protein